VPEIARGIEKFLARNQKSCRDILRRDVMFGEETSMVCESKSHAGFTAFILYSVRLKSNHRVSV
jgi:hypothetical protein